MSLQKIKMISIIKVIAVLDILCWYHFFYIIKMPDFANKFLSKYNYSTISSIVGLICSLICIYSCGNLLKNIKKYCVNYILILTYMYFVMIMYTSFKYPAQNFIDTIKVGGNFLHLYWMPTFLTIYNYDGGIKNILKMLNKISFVWYLLILIQFLIYNMSGKLILGFAYLIGDKYTRMYGLRISVACFGVILILYNYLSLYEKDFSIREKIFNGIQFLLGIICVIYVHQTRMMTLILFICLFYCIFACKKRTKVRRIELLCIVGVLAFLYFTHYFSNMYQEFMNLDITEGNVSVTNRLYSIEYYSKCFFNNIIFGNSLVSEVYPYYKVVHGPLKNAYYSDVGVIGVLGQLGLCSIIFFFHPFLSMISTLIKKGRYIKNNLFEYNILSISILYILLTSFTLIITDNSREPLFAIIFAFAIYLKQKYKNV